MSVACDAVAGSRIRIVAPVAGVSVEIPEGWVGASLEGGSAGVGAQLFPNDPEAAAIAEERVLVAMPRAVVLMAIDPSLMRSGFVPNMNVLQDTTAPSGMPLAELGAAQARGLAAFGADVEDTEQMVLGTNQAFRISYRLMQGAIAAVSFVVPLEGETWVLTYTFGDEMGAEAVGAAQCSAASFQVG